MHHHRAVHWVIVSGSGLYIEDRKLIMKRSFKWLVKIFKGALFALSLYVII